MRSATAMRAGSAIIAQGLTDGEQLRRNFRKGTLISKAVFFISVVTRIHTFEPP